MAEKILIVDDDLDTLKLVGLILQRHGYQIVAANGGVQALTKAASERPDMILLDLMMPDLDGYEVTRRLRADSALAQIPIIMFTAKTMLDDKVAGFEAGADDYLTKPTHPSELVAHVKALLARASTARAAPVATERARIVGCLAAKGGVGLTTVALNIAAIALQAGQEVIAADLHAGSGSLGLMLNLPANQHLGLLLAKPAGELNPRTVGGQIVSHASGLRVLPAAASPREADLLHSTAQFEAIVKSLSSMCKLLVLDLGPGLTETARRLVPQCDSIVLVTDPSRVAVLQSKAMIGELNELGLTASKIEVVSVNRAPSTIQMPWTQVEQILGNKIASIVTPAAELAYQSLEAATPMVLLRPESLTADQLRQLANQVMQKLHLS